MQISGWGRYPVIEANLAAPQSPLQVQQLLQRGFTGIGRGMGRSYGDSALAESVLSALPLHHILDFDDGTGVVTCQAGVTLADLLSVFVPRGWFLPVTPGTKFVTVGGAIASDVHGKNHHIDGSFSAYVESLTLTIDGESSLHCSREHHRELFQATCGGMGLTGVILQASLRLLPIRSAYINETTYKAGDLHHILDLFEQHGQARYSVAWIDCATRGRHLGRSLLMLGEHLDDGDFGAPSGQGFGLPMDMPAFTLNQYSIKAFNSLFFHRKLHPVQSRRIHYDPYFYPLDKVQHWNRLYGKGGFTQYQFVIPKAAGREGVQAILKRIVDSHRGSFLSVLKTFGPENANYLSFPKEGYTLALDFKLESGVMELLNELDAIVLDYEGRLYLTKDARMSEAMFKSGYARWEEFVAIRKRYGCERRFNSMQSKRLGM